MPFINFVTGTMDFTDVAPDMRSRISGPDVTNPRGAGHSTGRRVTRSSHVRFKPSDPLMTVLIAGKVGSF